MAESRKEKVQKLVDAIIPEGSGSIPPLQTDILRALQTLLLNKPEEKAKVAKLVAKKIHGRYPEASEEYLRKLCEAIEDFSKTELTPTPKPLLEPSPEPSPSSPPPQGEGTAPPSPSPPKKEGEPAPEAATETPGFSRYLKDILADPAAPEAVNLLIKFRSPNGRLWVDRKRADGSAVRIWFSLNLTPEEKSKPDAEFIAIIKGKLAPGGLRFRVDDLSAGHSWKEKWTTKKADISALVAGVAAASETEHPAACARIAEALFGTEETAKPNREALLALLQQYLARPDGKSDIWTHVRNAYWNADGWKNETDAKSELGGVGIPPDSLKPPSYASAKIRVWQKIGEEPRSEEIEGKAAPLFYNGTKFAAEIIEKTVIADGVQKGTWYRIGPHWVREEHLRISLRQNPPLHAGEGLGEGTFELMAWRVQTQEPREPTPTAPAKPPASPPAGSPVVSPKKGPKPTATPSAALGGPKPLPKSPPVVPPPTAKKKGGTDATPPTTAAPEAAPAPKQPAKSGPTKAPSAAPPKVASPSGSIPAPVTNESLRKQLENAKDVLPPTAENLTEQWLRANRGKKLLLRLEKDTDPRPCIIGCLAGKPHHDTAGRVCLCFVHSSGHAIFWHKTFDIAGLRRLNLSPSPP